jgi:Zinc-binding loop region of homing endonuclease
MSDSETPTKNPIAKKSGPRRKSGSLRKEHATSGAFMIQFQSPAAPLDMFRRQVPPSLRPASLLTGKDLQSAQDKYRTMERKGFLVTKDTGCLIPHEQYCTHQQGATIKGYQRTFAFFAQWCPTKGTLRNQWGWPMQPQISHLCHRRSCARPDHIIAEEQWRNMKRNFCGASGSCDCGNEIKCLRRYQMEDQADDPPLCLSEDEVREALSGAPPHVIHGSEVYSNRDQKAAKRKANREKRQRKQAAHGYATARKQARLGTGGGKDSTDGSDED